MTLAAHLTSTTNEWYTRSAIVERARRLMGEIDLDPASCVEANETVRAKRFFAKKDDGLSKKWSGRVFLNPPGGKLKRSDDGKRWVVPPPNGKGESGMAVWWDRLAEEWQRGTVEQAVFMGFKLDILRTSQGCALPVQAFPRCYPRSRLCFDGAHPPHSPVLIYLPPRGRDGFGAFRDVFGDLGLCERGALG